jgi:23S rRNA pseudouridine1911/1915/1917 synthase
MAAEEGRDDYQPRAALESDLLQRGQGSRMEALAVVSMHQLPATFHLVAETGDFLVVDKPPFLEAHPSKPGGARTLWDGLRELLAYEIANGGQVSIINRLDRETSGLTIIAKTRDAARALSRQMQARTIAKEYLALVWGWPEHDEWEVDAPLLRLGSVQAFRIWLKQGIHPGGCSARTRFRVERRFRRETSNGREFAIVRAFPETGRTHQIRVHLAHSGHAIVGDKIYGPDEGCYLEFIETGWTPALAERLLLPRHSLHSAALRLEPLGPGWKLPLPKDLAAFADD